MDLKEFGEELKRLRLDKQVSLMDISFSTRINIRFLEAIEAGKFSVLPQTYIRAFLREYGEAIGMGGEEVLRRYDTLREPPALPNVRESVPPSQPPAVPRTVTTEPKKLQVSPAMKKNILFAGLLMAVVAFVLILRSPSIKNADDAQEMPFDNVVKEAEATTFKPDSQSAVVIPPPVVTRPDSLFLEMSTTDSVWVSILVDGKKTLEYLFPPNRKRMFSARDQFSVTIGNAGGATFKLNGKDLGTLGKRGAVIRNVLIDEARLKSL